MSHALHHQGRSSPSGSSFAPSPFESPPQTLQLFSTAPLVSLSPFSNSAIFVLFASRFVSRRQSLPLPRVTPYLSLLHKWRRTSCAKSFLSPSSLSLSPPSPPSYLPAPPLAPPLAA